MTTTQSERTVLTFKKNFYWIMIIAVESIIFIFSWKQPFRGVLIKRRPENTQQIYRRTPMSKCDFEVRWHFSMGVPLHIFRTPFPNNIPEELLLFYLKFQYSLYFLFWYVTFFVLFLPTYLLIYSLQT